MRWWTWVVIVLIAASCSAPEPPESWSAQRVSPSQAEVSPTGALCDEIRSLALGSHADDADLGPTLDALAGISAVLGVTASLPLLNEVQALDDNTTLSDAELLVARHDPLVEASLAIDEATMTACEIPVFSALYAASGFPACHFEMEIAVGAYTLVDEPATCTADGRPQFLPCWSVDGDHLPIDCVTGEIVHAVGERWEPAGPADPVIIERPVPDEPAEPDGPLVIAPTGAPACTGLAALFRVDDPPNGAVPDFDRLAAAAAGLEAGTQDLIGRFIDASASAPSLDEFEALVTALDQATAAQCGLPIVSAWTSIVEPVDVLPCWLETGVPYPAFEQTPCS